MGHAGASRKSPNDAPWEKQSRKACIVSLSLHTTDTHQNTEEGNAEMPYFYL